VFVNSWQYHFIATVAAVAMFWIMTLDGGEANMPLISSLVKKSDWMSIRL